MWKNKFTLVHACLIVNYNNSTISMAIIDLKYVNLKKNTSIKIEYTTDV